MIWFCLPRLNGTVAKSSISTQKALLCLEQDTMFSFWMHLPSHRSTKHNVVFIKSVFHPWLSMSRIFVVVHLKTGKWKYGVSTTPWRPSLITIYTELVFLVSFRGKQFLIYFGGIFNVLDKNVEGSICHVVDVWFMTW